MKKRRIFVILIVIILFTSFVSADCPTGYQSVASSQGYEKCQNGNSFIEIFSYPGPYLDYLNIQYWYAPTNIKNNQIIVEAWGGGGGGGSRSVITQKANGAGGGAGGYSKDTLSILVGKRYIISVGKGGQGAYISPCCKASTGGHSSAFAWDSALSGQEQIPIGQGEKVEAGGGGGGHSPLGVWGEPTTEYATNSKKVEDCAGGPGYGTNDIFEGRGAGRGGFGYGNIYGWLETRKSWCNTDGGVECAWERWCDSGGGGEGGQGISGAIIEKGGNGGSESVTGGYVAVPPDATKGGIGKDEIGNGGDGGSTTGIESGKDGSNGLLKISYEITGSLSCSATPNPANVGQAITLTASGGSSPYTWSTGEGTLSAYTGSSVTISYSSAGTKTAVSAEDNAGTTVDCPQIIVQPPACSDEQTIMRLFSQINSHVSPSSDTNAPMQVCYKDIFGVDYVAQAGTDTHVCSANNIVLRTSAATNAHAEKPDGTTEGYSNLCYGDLNCRLVASAEECGSAQKERLIAYLSAETDAHVSKFDAHAADVLNWYKLCCKSPTAPVIWCGDGTKNGAEECDGTDIGICNPETQYCTSLCTCRSLSELKQIKRVEWRENIAKIDSIRFDMIDEVSLNLHGETIGFSVGDSLKIDVSKLDSLENIIDATTKTYGAKVGEGGIVSKTGKLTDFVNGKIQAGDKFRFKIYEENGFLEEKSNILNVLPKLVENCGDITEEDECISSAPVGGKCQGGYVCGDFVNGACVWGSSGENPVCKCKDVIFSGDTEAGSCTFKTTFLGECKDYQRTVDIEAEYVKKNDKCPGDEPNCKSKTGVILPCGRALVALPFFSWLNIIEVIVLIVVAYFVNYVFLKRIAEKRKSENKISLYF
jgi:hypothetical protein